MKSHLQRTAAVAVLCLVVAAGEAHAQPKTRNTEPEVSLRDRAVRVVKAIVKSIGIATFNDWPYPPKP